MNKGILLQVEHISKSFGKVKVLNDISLEVHKGEVLALSGENGAGKSTLMKIVAGLYPPDTGVVRLNDRPYTHFSLAYARKRGVSLIYQELSIAPNISVMENIFMGSEQSHWGLLDKQEMHKKADQVLRLLNASFDSHTEAGMLSVAQQQMVEIARAISHNSELIIMDEPTASLSKREVATLFELIRLLKKQGITIVYISHKMDEIQQIADRVSVLRDGEYIGDSAVNDLNNIIYMMVGRSLESFYEHTEEVKPTTTEHFTLQIKDLSDEQALVKDVNCELSSGMVTGLFGLVGAGRSELAHLIFGAEKKRSGGISLNGQAVAINSPIDAVKHGIGMVPEDRKLQGLFLDMSSMENIVENTQIDNAYFGYFINKYKNEFIAKKSIAELNIKTTLKKNPRALSGGNQQKILLSRWLNIQPKVLILDEPTRGIDVGAKHEIYKFIRELVAKNTLVLFISSELPEMINISDRLLIMKDGKLVGDIRNRKEFSQEYIMRLCTQ